MLGAAFDLALVSSTAARPAHAHTQARLRSNLPCKFERKARCTTCARHECGRPQVLCGRTYSSWAFRDLFLGHISPTSPSFPHSAVRPSTAFLHSPLHILPRIQKNTTHHRHPSLPHHPPSHRRPLSGHFTHRRPHIWVFPHFFPENPFLPNSSFFFIFFHQFWAQIHSWIVTHCFSGCLGLILQGVGLF
jgi:hypothetical protein